MSQSNAYNKVHVESADRLKQPRRPHKATSTGNMAVTKRHPESGQTGHFSEEREDFSAPRLRRSAFTRLDVSSNAWRALAGLNLYRWLIGITLALAKFSGYGERIIGVTRPHLFSFGCLALLALAAVTTTAHRLRWPPTTWQIYIHIGGDLTLITLLVYAAHGVPSGLAMLLIPPIAAAGVLRSRRMALLVAALASLALLSEETLRGLNPAHTVVNYTQAGILGGLFFLTVLSASLLEERIRESEALAERRGIDLASLAQLNERIIQRMQAGVIVVNQTGEIRMLNDAARTLLSLPSQAASLSKSAPELAASMQQWRDTPGREPKAISQRNGSPVLPHYTQLGSSPDSPVLILLDDASRIDRQAQQMKLAALGRLSASIAHEIRNPLSAISHAGQLLAESDALADSERHLLSILRRQTDRIDRVVENVLQLSRRNRALTEELQLRPWLEATIADYTTHHPELPLRFDSSAVEQELVVLVDPQQLHQVVCNLWDNTLQHASGEGEILISLKTGHLNTARPYLDITDNGPGIPPRKAERIFEPFYTTAHQGTGLGLYLAQELCASNDARLQCMPHSGGARFRIIFSGEGAGA